MSLLYINENGAQIGVTANQCTVLYKDGMKRSIPIESLEGITIMGQSQMTAKCAEECMKRGISVAYFSKGGTYFGRMMSTGHINVERQRKQSALYDTDFALELGKRILTAKIKNQSVVLRRYEKSRLISAADELKMMNICREKISSAKRIEEMIGYEGQAAKYYFKGLAMMEEWRAVIVDATAMSMINGHEIEKEDFVKNLDEPGCYLTKNGLKLYLNKLERKFQTEIRYLKYVDYAVSFRRGILLQMDRLARAIEEGDATIYEPVIIR